jgi:segregation and condensation protein A
MSRNWDARPDRALARGSTPLGGTRFGVAAPRVAPTLPCPVPPPDSDLRIKLPAFEGPLDLLLFLIRKNELDIYDIPIEAVTRQYIEVIRSMHELDLEIAGDFFVMAATLMEIKSRMLLPKGQAAVGEEDDEVGVDPRWELVHQLLQYRKFKEAAAELDRLARFEQDKLPRRVLSEVIREGDRPLKSVDRIELWNAFNIVLRRLAEKLMVGEIRDEQVTVADQMERLLKRLETQREFVFAALFPERVTLRLLVATFLAILELARLRKVTLRQNDAFDDILCSAVEPEALAPTNAPKEKPLESADDRSTVTA